ncbi:MAG: hypothetical protein ABEH43_02315 [Flavobacteriales bacterium]
MDLFDECKEMTIKEYRKLKTQNGCRFLYSSPESLKMKNGICFLGDSPKLNDGKKENLDLRKLDNDYNAFIDEYWDDNEERIYNDLQKRVQKLFRLLNSELGFANGYEKLMRNTLTSNLVFIRAEGSSDVKKEWRQFSKQVWRKVFSEHAPQIVILNGDGKENWTSLCEIFEEQIESTEKLPVNSTGYIKFIDSEPFLLGVPHLSKLFMDFEDQKHLNKSKRVFQIISDK